VICNVTRVVCSIVMLLVTVTVVCKHLVYIRTSCLIVNFLDKKVGLQLYKVKPIQGVLEKTD